MIKQICVALVCAVGASRGLACDLTVAVRDEKSQPLPGAKVTCHVAVPSGTRNALYSDTNGSVVFRELPLGDAINIHAEMPGMIPADITLQCLDGSAAVSLALVTPVDVPLVALLATPERYDGVFIRTEGFLTLGFERDRLYLSKADFTSALTLNSLMVHRADWMDEKKLNERHVALTARFKVADGTGWLASVEYCYALAGRLNGRAHR